VTARAPLLALALLAALALPGCEQHPPRTPGTSTGLLLPKPKAAHPATSSVPAPAPMQGSASASAAPRATAAAGATQTMGAARQLHPDPADVGDAQGAELLAQRALQMPVEGVAPERLVDTYLQGRGSSRRHEAIDILAPAGTPVVAVDDGRIAKLFTSKPGGLTIYQFDPGQHLAYYYAHLQRYAAGVHEGMDVKRGDVIGYVGSTGNADPGTPHLHFAVFRLGDPPKWWQGEAVNPYLALRQAQR
jgi:peptidoglycan LD-endopeptidase LytH